MFLVNTSPTFTVDFGSESVGTVTVTVTRADGTEIVTDDSTTDNDDGTYGYKLDLGLNDRLDRLRLTWTIESSGEEFTTFAEIVGSLLFTVDQAQNKTLTGQQTPLASKDDADIASVRQEITEWFEQKTARSWIRRYCRVELPGTGSRVIDLRDGRNRDSEGDPVGGQGRSRDIAEVISVTIGGTSQTVSEFEVDGSKLIHTGGSFARGTITDPFNVVVEYTYGHHPVPLEATDNGIRMAMKLLVPSDVPAFSTSFTGGDSTSTYPTGGFVLPSQVHQWLKRHQPVLIA